MMAAAYGDTPIVQALLDNGADPSIESRDGSNALADAVGGIPDLDGFTIGSCQTETVKALLRKEPQLRLKDNGYGRRARLFARISNCKEVLAMVD